MLRGKACRRFRARFEPGRTDGHRRVCPACAEFAAALDGAARAAADLPLPAALEHRLRALGQPLAEEAPLLFTAVPRLPLPAGLQDRLRALGRRPAAVPAWLRGPWHALAACFALALLLHGLLGSPVARAQPVAAIVGETLATALEQTSGRSQVLEEAVIDPAVASARRRLDSTRAAVGGWAQELEDRAQRFLGEDDPDR